MIRLKINEAGDLSFLRYVKKVLRDLGFRTDSSGGTLLMENSKGLPIEEALDRLGFIATEEEIKGRTWATYKHPKAKDSFTIIHRLRREFPNARDMYAILNVFP